MKAFRNTIQQLVTVYSESEAKALARWVMEERFGLSMTDLMLDKDNQLSSLELQDLENITKRLLQKEPVQYILGHTSFCGLSLNVNPAVLIPRPETQELVEWICNEYPLETRLSTHVLDIGTGSGCIALSLAHYHFKVEAWDISQEALDTATQNAIDLNLDVRFFQKDIFQESLHSANNNEMHNKYDIIVSNPPYICQKEAGEMEANVLEYEPHLALFVPDEDPLVFYRSIATFAANSLKSNGKLFFEINRAYGEETVQMLWGMGFKDVSIKKDQFGNSRMVRATISK